MNKLAFIFKSVSLIAALGFPLVVQSKQDFASNGLWAWFFYNIASSVGPSEEIDEIDAAHEKELMERFSKLKQGGLPDDPELMGKLYSHMYYTEDLEARNNPFVHRLLAHYTPGSAAYEELKQPLQGFLRHLAIMEGTYRNPADYESEDEGYPPVSEIRRMLAEKDAREARS